MIALKIAQSEPYPDLILLVVMTGMSGFEVARELQTRPYTNQIPIIFLTGKTDAESIAKGFAAGGVGYVTKPFNPNELQARIKTHLKLKAMREKLENLSRKLGKYLSPTVYDSIFSGEKDVKIESYRKVLSVCFTDIVSFTNTAESMDHHELTKWLNGYLNEMAIITIKHKGTLDKFFGDAVMVFYGDPISSRIEIDALNCIKMAQEMIEKAKEIGVNIRGGINTGMCTIGNFGSDDRMDYTIIGKEVNLASRLESNSKPGRILFSETTYEMIKDTINCTSHDQVQMKGIDREFKTYFVD